jgi:hypothetical protein
MTHLWPQIPDVVASRAFEDMLDSHALQPATSHPAQLWSPVGGRVATPHLQGLQEALTSMAQARGYPESGNTESRIAFDREAALLLRERMDLDWSEAGRRGVWSFMSLVLLPHLTMWRFGIGNRERWVATDLTRHTWARLWWQAVVFAGQENLLHALSESDLNQLLERRSIGGDPRLVCALATAILVMNQDAGRRAVIREASKRLRRLLAFVDVAALDDHQIKQLAWRVVAESNEWLAQSEGARQ